MTVCRFVLLAAICTSSFSVIADAAGQDVFTQDPAVANAQVRDANPAGQQATKPASDKAANNLLDHKSDTPVKWIWGSKPAGSDDRFFFRKQFDGGSKAAELMASCDNRMTVFINGQRVASSSEWGAPATADVQKYIRPGKNELLVEGANAGGPAGLALKLVLESSDGKRTLVATDESWEVAKSEDAKEWLAATELGKMGAAPWNDVFSNPAGAGLAAAQRDVFNVLPGFQVELLYTVPKASQGSWVCLTTDDKGRLIASDQGGQGLFRITPAVVGGKGPTKVEKLDVAITSAQGMLHAFGSLYVSVNGGPGSGLYRCRDTNGDDQYDEVKLLKRLQGGGEHGPHALRLSPDGKSIYLIAGNHTDPPQNFDASRLPSNWSEDLLLPRQWDARGHARGKLAPGGWIAKTDPEGTTWEMFSSGYRNPYDMDFNADGELFAYDADMEWDMGTPWYRPTRVVHATSGSEFGWRSGTGKWPTYYVDSLPQLVDVGPGSPVGATFGYGARFPAKYQTALYILDWTFGTMYAIHIEPSGASYAATMEEFVSRTPLPLTDAVVGADGGLYFTIGGRGAQSELYRVTYVGDQSTAPVDATNAEFVELRALRRELESLHGAGPNDGKALEMIFRNLGHDDRHIRYAARVALEHREPRLWQERALSIEDPQARITAIVALARQGDKSLHRKALAALEELDYASLSEAQQLEYLRGLQLVFIRLGQPDRATASRFAKLLDPHYPADSNDLNRELCNLLVYLDSPTVVTKTLALMKQENESDERDLAELLARNSGYGGTIAKMLTNFPELQKIHYAFALRNVRYGWTLDQRKEYFEWFNGALKRSGGASYQGFINNIRDEALAKVSPAEKAALEATTIEPPPKLAELPQPKGPGREWTVDAIEKLTKDNIRGRDFENGRRAYAASQCIVCHRFDGEGGATGPDLSNVAGRFGIRDLSEALVEPSKVVSDQYRGSVVTTLGGQVITGRVVDGNEGKITVLTDPFDANKVVTLNEDDIDEIVPAKVSLMPRGLLDKLNADEVLDLIAYLYSRGNPNDPMFAAE